METREEILLGAEPGQPRIAAELNPPQAEAAAHVDGPMVVFAGAGSGKTRVITFRIANLLATHKIPPYRILSVTFTNKAAAEMKRRISGIVGADLVRDLWIGTFHATCARMLRRAPEAAGLSKGFIVYDDDDQRAVMSRIYKDLRISDKEHPARQVLGRIHREKQDGILASEFEPRTDIEHVVSRCFLEYEKRLADANAVDFDDLLVKVLRMVEDPESAAGRDLARKFSHVLVDEFQDVNLVQYRLVRGLTKGTGNLFVVGDDDQSIYRWRGADVRIVRNFHRDHPGAKMIKLEENYRSTANVVSAALAVIAPSKERVPKELWTQNPGGDKVAVVACANERDEAWVVVGRIRELIDAGVSLSEIAVFYRVHAQSRVLEEELRKERIAYQVIGGTRFFERAEVKDLVSYLRVISNPKSDVDLVRIVNVPPRKIGDTTVERLGIVAAGLGQPLFQSIPALCETDRIGPQPKKALAHFHALMSELIESAETASPREIAERVLEETGYSAMLAGMSTDEAEARRLNLQELVGAIGDYEEESMSSGEVPTLSGYLERIALTAAADELKDAPKVALMTVHAAKGLEFSHVFVTGMEEDMFPFRSQDDKRTADIEEERRLAYVAFTRARSRLTILHAERRNVFGIMKYGKASRFVEDLPPAIVATTKTEMLRAGGGRFIDRDFGPSQPARGGARPAWSHPQDRPARSSSSASDSGGPPSFTPGERYVERDDDAPYSTFRRLPSRAASGGPIGARVAHKQFGPGSVLEVDDAPDPTATVEFDAGAVKRIKLRFLQPESV